MNLRTFAPLALLALASCTPAPQTNAVPPKAQLFEKGMVSAADPRAAEAGAEMLRAGGAQFLVGRKVIVDAATVRQLRTGQFIDHEVGSDEGMRRDVGQRNFGNWLVLPVDRGGSCCAGRFDLGRRNHATGDDPAGHGGGSA